MTDDSLCEPKVAVKGPGNAKIFCSNEGSQGIDFKFHNYKIAVYLHNSQKRYLLSHIVINNVS